MYLVLMAPLALRRERWDDPHFRLLYACSALLFCVLFNHQAERASYVIAFAGATIWYLSAPRPAWHGALYAVAVLTIPVMSTLIPGAFLRTQTVMLYRLTLPTLAIWWVIQADLFRTRTARDASGGG